VQGCPDGGGGSRHSLKFRRTGTQKHFFTECPGTPPPTYSIHSKTARCMTAKCTGLHSGESAVFIHCMALEIRCYSERLWLVGSTLGSRPLPVSYVFHANGGHRSLMSGLRAARPSFAFSSARDRLQLCMTSVDLCWGKFEGLAR